MDRHGGGKRVGHRVSRALIVVCVFFIFQQITGINVPFYYGPQILGSFFSAGVDAVGAAAAGVEVTAILGAVNVVATYFAFRWIDKFGRRPLAMWGYAGMAVFMLSLRGVSFLTGIPKTVLVMVGFSFFITSFAIGVGGTGWLIQGEVFPTSVRGRAAAIGAGVDWVANFALIEVFPAWHNAWGWPGSWCPSRSSRSWPSDSCPSSCPRRRAFPLRKPSALREAGRRETGGRLAIPARPDTGTLRVPESRHRHHQIAVLQRQVRSPRLTWAGRQE